MKYLWLSLIISTCLLAYRLDTPANEQNRRAQAQRVSVVK